MACVHPQEEWTISTVTDVTGTKGLLVFCLNVNGKQITGQVSEVPVSEEGEVIGDPVLLYDAVTGSEEPIANVDLSFMTLIFRWGDARVMLAGIRFRSDMPNTFRGRFYAVAATPVAQAAASDSRGGMTVVPLAPGDGDTGTGTGTQT